MTIDEAIKHAKEVARTCDHGHRAADHMQLAEWLRQARGADKAARWYTAKIRELENRSKALETLISEKEAENAKLREFAKSYLAAVSVDCDLCPYCDPELCDTETDPMIDGCRLYEEMREMGIEVGW